MTKISELKNKYDGRAFLVGNGPTLGEHNLDLLIPEYAFATNRIAQIFDGFMWRPSFYVLTSLQFQRAGWKRDLARGIKSAYENSFLHEIYRGMDGMVFNGNEIWLPECSHGSYQGPTAPDSWWSDDVSKRVCKYGTSLLSMFQIAIYLGFKELILIGIGPPFKGYKAGENDPNHFSANYDGKSFVLSENVAKLVNGKVTGAHELAKRACERLGVSVFDATIGPGVGDWPKRDLKALINV
ncbi:MAG: hypothetical protein FVQ79_02225 [Planctomycetes bacterium]|nr:hypothetical protein [Planctomycetota bacterium]